MEGPVYLLAADLTSGSTQLTKVTFSRSADLRLTLGGGDRSDRAVCCHQPPSTSTRPLWHAGSVWPRRTCRASCRTCRTLAAVRPASAIPSTSASWLEARHNPHFARIRSDGARRATEHSRPQQPPHPRLATGSPSARSRPISAAAPATAEKTATRAGRPSSECGGRPCWT